MIANELADDLCARFVKRNDRVLDPFCGTGRTILASAEVGAHIVGIDINPLAIMLTRAKAGNPSPDKLRQVLEKIPQVRHHVKVRDAEIKDMEPGRSVDWFSLTCKKHLPHREILAQRLAMVGYQEFAWVCSDNLELFRSPFWIAEQLTVFVWVELLQNLVLLILTKK